MRSAEQIWEWIYNNAYSISWKTGAQGCFKGLQKLMDTPHSNCLEPSITDEEVVRRFNQLVDNVRVERRLLDGPWNDYPRSYEYRLKPPEKEEWEQAWEKEGYSGDDSDSKIAEQRVFFKTGFEAGRRKE